MTTSRGCKEGKPAWFEMIFVPDSDCRDRAYFIPKRDWTIGVDLAAGPDESGTWEATIDDRPFTTADLQAVQDEIAKLIEDDE